MNLAILFNYMLNRPQFFWVETLQKKLTFKKEKPTMTEAKELKKWLFNVTVIVQEESFLSSKRDKMQDLYGGDVEADSPEAAIHLVKAIIKNHTHVDYGLSRVKLVHLEFSHNELILALHEHMRAFASDEIPTEKQMNAIHGATLALDIAKKLQNPTEWTRKKTFPG